MRGHSWVMGAQSGGPQNRATTQKQAASGADRAGSESGDAADETPGRQQWGAA